MFHQVRIFSISAVLFVAVSSMYAALFYLGVSVAGIEMSFEHLLIGMAAIALTPGQLKTVALIGGLAVSKHMGFIAANWVEVGVVVGIHVAGGVAIGYVAAQLVDKLLVDPIRRKAEAYKRSMKEVDPEHYEAMKARAQVAFRESFGRSPAE